MSRRNEMKREWVHVKFHNWLDQQSRQSGVTKIKITERLIDENIVDPDDTFQRKLWGVLYVPKKKK